MFSIGMPEMAVIGIVALIVVGPKDLPQMFRKVGQFVGKARQWNKLLMTVAWAIWLRM